MSADLSRIDGVLLDIDGVLTVSWRPIPGAAAALRHLRDRGVAYRLLTNTTELSRRQLRDVLGRAGFEVRPEEILTAPVLTAAHLRERHAGAPCFLLGSRASVEDMEGVDLVGRDAPAKVVVVAGASEELQSDDLNHALRLLLDGAAFVSMHRTLAWMTAGGMVIDASVGFVPGLEEASGRRAVVCGKPSPEAFHQAVALLGVPAGRAAMVGDDLDGDALAARAAGLTGILVRTGKFRPGALGRAAARPDVIIDSVAELPLLIRP